MCLLGEILQEQGVHRALESDVEVRDVALGDRDDVDAREGESLEESRRVFLIAFVTRSSTEAPSAFATFSTR